MSITKNKKDVNKLYEGFHFFVESKQVENAIGLIKPDNCDSAFDLGIFYGQHGAKEVALKIFDRLTQIRPTDALVWLNKGVALVNSGYDWDAMQCFIQATQLDPELSGAWCEIGSLLVRWEEYRKALKFFKNVPEVPPCYAKIWWSKGAELIIKKRYKTALKYLNEALRIDPNFEDGFIEKGIALARLQQIPEALTCFKHASKSKQNVRAFHYLGIAYLKAGSYETALKNFKAALKIDATIPESWVGRAIAAERLDLVEEAHQCLEKALELRQDYDLAWFNKALLFDRQGKQDMAAESFDQALEINPNLLKQNPTRWSIPNANNSE